MEAKDTVMNASQLDDVQIKHEKEHPEMWATTRHGFTYVHHYIGGRSWSEYAAKTQAEISFKAGMREVVEWVEDNTKLLSLYMGEDLELCDEWREIVKECEDGKP